MKPYESTLRVQETFPVGAVEALGEGDYRVEFLCHGTTKTGSPRRHYPKRTQEAAAAAGIFDGAKVYLNHVTPGSSKATPHRDLRDWAGTLKPGSVRCQEGNLQAVMHVHLPEARTILDDPVAKAAVGLSHDSNIRVSKGRVNGEDVHVVEAIIKCHSVDLVPEGNASGRVLETTAQEENETMDLTPEQMEDLVKRVAESVAGPVADAVTAKLAESQAAAAKAEEDKRQQEAAEAAKPDADKQMDQRIAEAVAAQTAEQTKRIQEQADQLKALQDQQAAASTLAQVRSLVDARDDLSPTAKGRVIESFGGQILATDQIGTRVQEACDKERAYALSILQESGVRTGIRGTGATDSTRTQEAVQAYEEQFAARARAMGVDEKTLKAMQELPGR